LISLIPLIGHSRC